MKEKLLRPTTCRRLWRRPEKGNENKESKKNKANEKGRNNAGTKKEPSKERLLPILRARKRRVPIFSVLPPKNRRSWLPWERRRI